MSEGDSCVSAALFARYRVAPASIFSLAAFGVSRSGGLQTSCRMRGS